MFRPIAFISAVASVALAQAPTNPLIPTGISAPCSTFLNALDTDSSLSGCLKALTTATSSFAPRSDGTVTSSTISSTLSSLCADSVTSTCPESLIRGKITDFYSACNAELTSKIAEVIRTYDTIYALLPMRSAICSKDDNDNWCVTKSPGAASKGSVSVSQILTGLFTTIPGSQAVIPNMVTYHDNNLPFTFFKPDLAADILCTSCVRSILTSYMAFESNVVYAAGLGNSQILNTQPALYEAVKAKCPANFLSGAVQAAAGLSGGILSSSAVATYVHPEQQTLFALGMGTAMLAVTSLF